MENQDVRVCIFDPNKDVIKILASEAEEELGMGLISGNDIDSNLNTLEIVLASESEEEGRRLTLRQYTDFIYAKGGIIQEELMEVQPSLIVTEARYPHGSFFALNHDFGVVLSLHKNLQKHPDLKNVPRVVLGVHFGIPEEQRHYKRLMEAGAVASYSKIPYPDLTTLLSHTRPFGEYSPDERVDSGHTMFGKWCHSLRQYISK